jgi:hypothetical protein
LVVEETSRITYSRALQVNWPQFNDHNTHSDPPHAKNIPYNWPGHSYLVMSYKPLKYRYESCNDVDTCWEMHQAISSLCKHHRVYLHKPT